MAAAICGIILCCHFSEKKLYHPSFFLRWGPSPQIFAIKPPILMNWYKWIGMGLPFFIDTTTVPVALPLMSQ